ncbi:MAG: ribosomal L7Ae/L30e/S12e/Gadd45 family protein [Anaerolineae bacterium]|nr:ribosomal L7Ae/L30e/S12e/Gadd45 family protein [Gemmatimonadaceae bacterium]
MLRLVGLGLRGGLVVVGVDRVREAARRGKVLLAIVAPDAARNSLDKVVPLLDARGVWRISGPGAVALGGAVGRESTAVVGVLDRDLAEGIREIVESKVGGTH